MSACSRKLKAVANDQAGRMVSRCILQEVLERQQQVPESQPRHFPECPKVGFPREGGGDGVWGHFSCNYLAPSKTMHIRYLHADPYIGVTIKNIGGACSPLIFFLPKSNQTRMCTSGVRLGEKWVYILRPGAKEYFPSFGLDFFIH